MVATRFFEITKRLEVEEVEMSVCNSKLQNTYIKRTTAGCTVYVTGVLDAQTRYAYLECGHPHVHVGPEVPGDPSRQVGELDAANQIAAAARFRRVRVPGQHRAENVAQL